MDFDSCIRDIKDALKFTHGIISCSTYSNSRKQLATIYLSKGEEIEGIYNLTESHATGLRQIGISESARSPNSTPQYFDCLSFEKEYARDEANGMMRRLKEMPPEWTIVQLTRSFDNKEKFNLRMAETSPKLKNFHLTRLPCGSELRLGCPVTVYRNWPQSAPEDLIEDFWKIKKQLSIRGGPWKLLKKQRNEAALDVEKYCREIGEICLKEWLVLFLGTICDTSLSDWIKRKVDEVIKKKSGLNKRQIYMTYLLAEGAAHISDDDLDSALCQLYSDDLEIQDEIVSVLEDIKKEKPNLAIVRRNPTILIIDEHLDLIPWESLLVLRRHPISRIPSLHFAHGLYKVHSNDIKNGLKELDSSGLCYYVLNPSGDLQSVEQRILNFIRKRFPSWVGIVGEVPSEKQIIEAVTKGNAFIYCGHGSGFQYLSAEAIQRVRVKSVQLLFGCSSVALKDHGGCIEMTGDFLQFAVAGSGCTLGMLWPVTSNDVDRMTLVLANMWLPGEPIDIENLEVSTSIRKEPELLRAVVEVRKCANLFSNGAAFVARGIPTKLV